MSDELSPPAARLHDPVAHSHALGGFVAGALVGLAAAAGVAIVVGMAATAVAAEVATAGLATPLVAGVAVTVGEFAVNAVVGGKLMGLAEDAGETLGSKSMAAPSGEISQGSPNVFINGLPAARVTDTETCDAGKVAQGSATVFINGLPAARVGDKVTCGAVIVGGSGNVFIGGGTTSPLPIQSEVPQWARWAAVVVGILPALGGAARAIGPALAEVEATGLARAAQTGVKALGRQMEARAGAVRSPTPFESEPMIPPKATVKTSDFKAERPGGLEINNLSPADAAARSTLKRGGWDPKMQEQVLDSGSDFRLVNGQAGDTMYGFSSKGYAKGADSAYWMDEPTYRDMQTRHQDPATGEWNSPGVKNKLALPCYNRADAVYSGQLAQDQTMVASTINPATESVTYVGRDGAELTKFERTMTGGGTQVAPAKGTVGNITEHTEP
ncbi:MAG TPA: PAAR domain-containing protein [Sphingomicrobium sp.]